MFQKILVNPLQNTNEIRMKWNELEDGGVGRSGNSIRNKTGPVNCNLPFALRDLCQNWCRRPPPTSQPLRARSVAHRTAEPVRWIICWETSNDDFDQLILVYSVTPTDLSNEQMRIHLETSLSKHWYVDENWCLSLKQKLERLWSFKMLSRSDIWSRVVYGIRKEKRERNKMASCIWTFRPCQSRKWVLDRLTCDCCNTYISIYNLCTFQNAQRPWEGMRGAIDCASIRRESMYLDQISNIHTSNNSPHYSKNVKSEL